MLCLWSRHKTCKWFYFVGPLSPQEQCAVHGGIFPHPTECQAYYNCSMVYQSVPMLLEQHMMECQYPELFNAETNRCDHFENVKCGPRTEFKDGCKYLLGSISCFLIQDFILF